MKPDFAIISQQQSGDEVIISVDTSKATYQGIAWRTLGDLGKRKFDNLLILQDAQQRKRIIYV